MKKEESPLLDVYETAALLRMHPVTLRKKMKSDPEFQLLRTRRIGRRIYWLRSSVMAWIEG